jgi:hypothetical protein
MASPADLLEHAPVRGALAHHGLHVVQRIDLGTQLAFLRAQHGAFALHVHQAQLGGGTIGEHAAHRALDRAQLGRLVEPGAQVAEHGAVFCGQRQAEVAVAALRCAGIRLRVDGDQYLVAVVHARAGCAGEVVFVVGDGACRPPHGQRARSARGRGLTHRGLARTEDCTQVLRQDGEEVLAACAGKACGQQFQLFAGRRGSHRPMLFPMSVPSIGALATGSDRWVSGPFAT